MNCKQAKTHVALLIGNDLEPTALQEVRNHLDQCLDCRKHFERLSSCLEVLQSPPHAWSSEGDSLWPNLSVRLASANAGQKPHRLSGWAPTLAVAAACTAMFWVASSRWTAIEPVGQPAIYNEIQLRPQPVVDPPSSDRVRSAPRKGTESRPGRTLHDPNGDESGIIPFHGPGSSAIPVVPVNEPAH